MVHHSATSSSHSENSRMEVPMTLFAENRRRLISAMKSKSPNSIIFLQGGSPISLYNTDVEYHFRQEPFFHWLFGVSEPDFYGALDVSTGKSYLFYEKIPESYVVWIGDLPSPESFKNKYQVDYVLYADEMFATLSNLNRETMHLLQGKNTDSDLMFKSPEISWLKSFKTDYSTLYPIIVELRVIKTPMEIEVIKYACKISSEAHKNVMKNLKAGMYEYQGESLFLHYIYSVGGCRFTAYTCICGSGENASILHYGHAAKPNDRKIEHGDLCLFDMGGSYYGYASDITVTFPITGKFTKNQEIVYTAVFNARAAVFKALGPGVFWTEMHEAGIKAMLEHLKNCNLLKSSSVDEMFKAGLGAVFQPHGLGHLLGIDVHDVGGYTEETPCRPTKYGLHTLRTARKLQPGMVVTVEPGCYFIDSILDSAFNNPALNCFLTEQINQFRGIGGVRLEDDVLITDSGYEILSADIPRTIEEIESFMSS